MRSAVLLLACVLALLQGVSANEVVFMNTYSSDTCEGQPLTSIPSMLAGSCVTLNGISERYECSAEGSIEHFKKENCKGTPTVITHAFKCTPIENGYASYFCQDAKEMIATQSCKDPNLPRTYSPVGACIITSVTSSYKYTIPNMEITMTSYGNPNCQGDGQSVTLPEGECIQGYKYTITNAAAGPVTSTLFVVVSALAAFFTVVS